MEGSQPRWSLLSAQTVVGVTVAAFSAILLLSPIFFLLQASLDVGDPEATPPTAYGFDNYATLLQYSQILVNTVLVSLAATVMAMVFGFVMAWILSRTDVPGRRTFEQLMAIPYYVTPLLGAFAWSLLGAPESGFINQVWRALGGEDRLIDIVTPLGIASTLSPYAALFRPATRAPRGQP